MNTILSFFSLPEIIRLCVYKWRFVIDDIHPSCSSRKGGLTEPGSRGIQNHCGITRGFAHWQSGAFSEPKTYDVGGRRRGILFGISTIPERIGAEERVPVHSLRAATDSSRHILMTCLWARGFHFTALCLRLSYPVSRHFPPSAAPITHVSSREARRVSSTL